MVSRAAPAIPRRLAVRTRARRALLVLLLLAAAAPAADAAAPACQAAIERVGYRHTQLLLRQIKACATATASASLTTCLGAPEKVSARDAMRARWTSETAAACAGTDLASDLGYLATCAAAPSGCTFSTAALDAPGPRNDLLDCLGCRITESLTGAGVKLYADQPVRNACHQTVGGRGVGFAKKLLRMLKACQVDEQKSVAACLSAPANAAKRARLLEGWREASVAACAGSDPFAATPSYPTYCSGQAPAVLPSCGATAPPCTFSATTKIDDPTQSNDDLIDCTSCRAEEAVLEIARDLYGANLCCVGDDCVVRTRRGCLREGGEPAHYLASTVAADIYSPHALAIGGDGMVYVADTGFGHIRRITPQGQTSFYANLGTIYDVGVDPVTGEVYAGLRCGHRVVRVAQGGALTTVAGTGVAGHSGDGGPAVSAAIAAPNKTAVDDQGNVYFTESGFVSLLCGSSALGTERVRKISPDGTISTVAGVGGWDTGGIGGPATQAGLAIPLSVETGPDGVVVIGEGGMNRVLRIEADQTLTHVAGTPMSIVGAYSGDGGPATRARINSACGVAAGPDGRVYIADMIGNRIRVVDREGSIISIAGNGLSSQPLPDGQPGLLADAGCPEDVALAPDGRVYFGSLYSNRVRILTLARF